MRTRTGKRYLSAGAALVVLAATVTLAPASPAQDPKLAGQWTQPFWEGGADPFDPFSLEKSKAYPTAVGAVMLPDGRFLYWNGIEGGEDGEIYIFDQNLRFTIENSRTRILDLRSEQPRWTIPTFERGTTDEPQDEPHMATHDIFCGDQKLLYDGTVLVAGGTEWRGMNHDDPDLYGDDETRIFDPRTDSFRSVEPMREPRWYPSLVTLADGRMLVTTGVRRVGASASNPEPSFSQVRLSEIYDPRTEEWTDAGTAQFSLPLYSRLHLLPDGKVFYGGAGQSWTPLGHTADMATWSLQRTYDPATGKWTLGSPSLYGVRNSAASTLLRLEAPYDSARVLIAGGTAGAPPTTAAGTTLSEVITWTADGRIRNETVPKAPMAGLAGDRTQLRNPRWGGIPLNLPTGEVLLLNGADTDDLVDPGSAGPIRNPELYDPATNSWRELAPAARDRVYHHSAVLLPDGSVLVGGHAPQSTHYYRYGLPGARYNNYRDSTFEIYKPPYLFRGPRPVLSSVSPVAGGLTLKLGIGSPASEISEVTLVRLASNTHSLDSDTRSVKLEHKAAGSNVFAELPNGGDGRILPPGPYYVFAMKDTPDGPVPSIAQTILVQPRGDGKVVAVAR